MQNILRISTILLIPILAAILLYQFDTFNPVAYPDYELIKLSQPALVASKQNGNMLRGSEKIGEGQLVGPEDIAYDPKTGFIYTGTRDGWLNRVRLNDSVIEKWVNTGGQPLGIVHGFHGEVIVADAEKGLLNISKEGTIEVLSDEADGLKFKLTDALDIARDGTIYFTDASHKYNLPDAEIDILEGGANGRFMSYNPSIKQTEVLVSDLYFANGVAVSADHSFVIFCETPMRRCKKFYINGEKKGSVDIFVENLPGLPDNIHYDGEDNYWIALLWGPTNIWRTTQKSPFIRKVIPVMEKYGLKPKIKKNGGVISVNLDGEPIAHYYDHDVSMITSGVKIGEYLYCGSVFAPYILRLNVQNYPAIPAVD